MFNIKPDWKDAPVWALWLAQDEYGAWGWYERKPSACKNYGLWDILDQSDNCSRPENTNFKVKFKKNPNWRDTLEMRED